MKGLGLRVEILEVGGSGPLGFGVWSLGESRVCGLRFWGLNSWINPG